MTRFFERALPLLFALLVACGYWIGCHYFLSGIYIPNKIENLFNAGISVAGVMVAFVATLQGILISLDKSPIVIRLQELGAYKLLISYFSSAVRWGFALIIVSAAGLFLDFTNPAKLQKVFFIGWLGIAIMAAATAYRIIYLFGHVVRANGSTD